MVYGVVSLPDTDHPGLNIKYGLHFFRSYFLDGAFCAMSMIKEDVIRLLDSQGIHYDLAEHGPVYTIEEIDALKLANADGIAKNLFIRDDKKRQYFLLTMQKDRRADLKQLQACLGTRKLSLASEADLGSILGLIKGTVTPLGVLNDQEHRVTVLLDTAFQGRLIGVHLNTNTATVWLRTDDLFYLIEQHGNAVRWIEI